MRLIFSLAVFVASIFSAAFAGDKPLTSDEVKRFVATIPATNALGEQFEAEGKIDILQVENQEAGQGTFGPYSHAIGVLKEKHVDGYKRLNAVVSAQGFEPVEWGAVGDRVMISYLALKMKESDPDTLAMMEGMDRSMLEMVPPEMRAQLEQTFLMMEAVKSAPEADQEVVAEFQNDLDAMLGENDFGLEE